MIIKKKNRFISILNVLQGEVFKCINPKISNYIKTSEKNEMFGMFSMNTELD